MRNLIDKVKRYYGFNKSEVQALVVTSLVLGFVFGFDDGRSSFNAAFWLMNFFNCVLLVALALLVSHSAVRVLNIHFGYKPEFKMSVYGLIFCLILSLASYGKIIFLLPGFFVVSMLEGHRIGKFRYGIVYKTLGGVSLLGPATNMLLAVLFKGLSTIPFLAGNALIEKAILINMLFAVYYLVPIPMNLGIYIFYWSRLGFAFIFSTFLGLALMINFSVAWWIIILTALVVGGIGWLLFYVFFEQEAWEYV
jgi:hypothetical protein